MTDKTRTALKSELKGVTFPNVYLGINYQKLFLLTPSKKEVIISYPIQRVSDV